MVEQVELGRTGLTVSRLCVGSWQAAGWTSSNDRLFLETLSYAFDHGLNFIDTAEGYGEGHAEELIGRAIRGRRGRIIIATKFNHTNGTPAAIRRALEGSLHRMGVEQIDLYQQHWPPKQPPLEATIAELERLREEGKIRAIGVSNWMEPEWRELDNPSRIHTLQPCYNLCWRAIERSILALCRKHRIAVISYSPLCQGLLSGKFQGNPDVPADSRRQNRFFNEDRTRCAPVIKGLETVAAKYNKSPAQVALRWVLDNPDIATPIVGASCPEQIKENLGSLGWRLAPEDYEQLSNLSTKHITLPDSHDTLWKWHPRKR